MSKGQASPVAEKKTSVVHRLGQVLTTHEAIVAFGIALVSGVTLLGFNIAQLIYMRQSTAAALDAAVAAQKSIEIAADSAKKQLRAYVHVARYEIDEEEDGLTVVRVVLTNKGQTPADITSHLFAYLVGPYPYQGKFPDPMDSPIQNITNQGTLASGAEQFTPTIPIKVESGIAKRLKERTSAIWVAGKITYVDIYGEPHKTRYRVMIQGGGRYDKDTVVNEPEGNSAD